MALFDGTWSTARFTLTFASCCYQPGLDRLTAESRGWIKPSWYWTGIDAGFELWKGGQGLRVSYFNVDS